MKKDLNILLADCNLRGRANKILILNEIITLNDLVKLTRKDLLGFKNCGIKTVLDLEDFLESKGLRLADGKGEKEELIPLSGDI